MSILFDLFDISTVPLNQAAKEALKASYIDTPLGGMLAVADDNWLYLLQFIDTDALLFDIKSLKLKTNQMVYQGTSKPLESIERELKQYFEGHLKCFKTPFQLLGTSFQRQVWQKLLHIPYGTTTSYLNLSGLIGRPQAYRAVANANRANNLCILIPCHRVIRANGDLCGYGGFPYRKAWLLELEKRFEPPII